MCICVFLYFVDLGLAAPDGDNGGFDETTKVFVVRCLKRIEREALYGQGKYSLGVSSSKLVGRARIPVLKLQCREVELDVSLNDDAGLKAARFLTSFVSVGSGHAGFDESSGYLLGTCKT